MLWIFATQYLENWTKTTFEGGAVEEVEQGKEHALIYSGKGGTLVLRERVIDFERVQGWDRGIEHKSQSETFESMSREFKNLVGGTG